MPLHLLAQPAFKQSAAHFEADDFMAWLHEEVINCHIAFLGYIVEVMSLHHVCCIVPLLLLADQLAACNAKSHHVISLARPFVAIHAIPVGHLVVETLRVLPVRVFLVDRIRGNQCRLLKGVRYHETC